MGALDPQANHHLFGHEATASSLAEAGVTGHLHHAWLLTGAWGIGKATLAFRLARWLLADRPEGQAPLEVPPDHPVSRRIAAGSHSDLRVLSPTAGTGVKRMIRVDDVRALSRFVGLTAAEGAWRIILIDQVEAMNAEAQNALLKTLEEPPPGALLLLVSAAPDRLLPTIRSRCRRLELFPLKNGEMQEAMKCLAPDLSEEQRSTLVRIGSGSPGKALGMAGGDGLALHEQVSAFLAALPFVGGQDLHQLADMLSSGRDGAAFGTFMALLRDQLGDALRRSARGQPAPAFLGSRPLADWATLWDTLGRLATETEHLNLDRRQAVLSGLSQLASR
ncbi:DNA polymerase III subunit delta' [Pseudoroseomonas globiformis]|uniref:DNA polymerase III subunit delta n=1 Tax=Teichococcus globiformis TaxID=2307229 RepID=A0ABV7FZP5_9PROT